MKEGFPSPGILLYGLSEGKMGFSGACSKGFFDGLKVTVRAVTSGGRPKTTMLKYAYLSYKTFERKSQPQNAYTCRVLHGFYMNTILKNSCLHIIPEKPPKLQLL